MGYRQWLANEGRRARSSEAVMQIQEIYLIDPISTIIRIVIAVVGVSLGIILLTRKRQHLKLGVLQIIISICAPLCMGLYCYFSKRTGFDVVSDLELFANHLKMVQYGAIMPILLLIPYIALIIVSTLSVKTIADNVMSKKNNSSKN